MHELVQEGLDLLAELKSLETHVLDYTIRLRQLIDRNALPIETLVDEAWVLHRIKKIADDSVRKEAHKLYGLAEKVLCAVWVAQCAADPEAKGYVEGDIARGTPKMGLSANVPERGTPEYVQLMQGLGLPDQVIGNDVVRPHWPHLCDLISQRAEKGLPPPPGIRPEDTRPLYQLAALRLKKGVNIEE